MELRYALDMARECVSKARAGGKGTASIEEARRLCRGLYESFGCLTIHGEFKESLLASPKTLKAMQSLVSADDLAEDPQLAFFYTSITYNLCRSREDKERPKRNEFPFNELNDDDLNAIEEFYEKMPAESRPAKNGDVDAGSKELAVKLRSWCLSQSSSGGAAKTPDNSANSNVVGHLSKFVVNGSMRVKALVALSLKFLSVEQSHRKFIVSGGGFRALLGLVDLEEEVARDAARQTLAQLCIVTNPKLLQYSDQLDAVRPLLQLLEHRHELLQFEAAMGLTNLLIVSDDLRSRVVQADGWRIFRDLLFSDNEKVQRAGLEAMCNLTMAPEVIERFIEGRAELEIKVFISFSAAEDLAAARAASGALAMLSGAVDEVAVRIAKAESFPGLLQALAEASDPGVQHRLVAACCNICEAEGCSTEANAQVRDALRCRRRKGLASPEAENLARELLEEEHARSGGG